MPASRLRRSEYEILEFLGKPSSLAQAKAKCSKQLVIGFQKLGS
jgi:hypothetical protein